MQSPLQATCREWYNVCSLYHRAKPVSDIAVELHNSEAMYARYLECFLSEYRDRLSAQKLLGAADSAAIFQPVELVARRAQNMLQLFRVALGADRPGKSEVAAVFCSTAADIERDFSDYCAAYPGAKAVVEKVLCNREVLDALGKDTTALTLDSFLIMPVQRVPRYLLMVNSMLHKTSDTHPNRLELLNAAELLQSCTSSINRGMQESEDRRAVTAALSAIADSPILGAHESVRLISDRVVMLNLCMHGSVVMLSDRLVIAVATPTKLRFRSQHWLDDVSARPYEDVRSFSVQLRTADMETLLVTFSRLDQQQKWLRQFADAQAVHTKLLPRDGTQAKPVLPSVRMQLVRFAEMDGSVLVRAVRPKVTMLSHSHCFVLQTFHKLYLWSGRACSSRELQMAERFVEAALHVEPRLGFVRSPFCDDMFFDLLGGTASQVSTEQCSVTQVIPPPTMLLFHGESVGSTPCIFSHAMLPLEKQGCAVIDSRSAGPVYVWASPAASAANRERAVHAAQDLAAPLQRLVELTLAGHEPALLQMLFLDWPGMQPPLISTSASLGKRRAGFSFIILSFSLPILLSSHLNQCFAG
jgi:hypothetical protein